jgi:hypothetical protein
MPRCRHPYVTMDNGLKPLFRFKMHQDIGLYMRNIMEKGRALFEQYSGTVSRPLFMCYNEPGGRQSFIYYSETGWRLSCRCLCIIMDQERGKCN